MNPLVTLPDAEPVGSTAGLSNLKSLSGATVAAGALSFTAASQSAVIDTKGFGGVSLTVSGFGSATLAVQWCDTTDGAFTSGAVRTVGNIGAAADATTITADGQYVANNGGRYLKITTTGWVSGTQVVRPTLRREAFPVRAVFTTAASVGYTATATFTPAAAAYSANDVMDVAKTFASIGPAGGGEVLITTARLQIATTAVQSGETSYDLHFYSATPPSAHADNDAWDEPSGDRTTYLGKISLGTPVDIGSTLEIKTNGINEQITVPSGGTLYAELVTVGAFTATAVARKVTIHAVAI
jgi:hypothetical protein